MESLSSVFIFSEVVQMFFFSAVLFHLRGIKSIWSHAQYVFIDIQSCFPAVEYDIMYREQCRLNIAVYLLSQFHHSFLKHPLINKQLRMFHLLKRNRSIICEYWWSMERQSIFFISDGFRNLFLLDNNTVELIFPSGV